MGRMSGILQKFFKSISRYMPDLSDIWIVVDIFPNRLTSLPLPALYVVPPFTFSSRFENYHVQRSHDLDGEASLAPLSGGSLVLFVVAFALPDQHRYFSSPFHVIVPHQLYNSYSSRPFQTAQSRGKTNHSTTANGRLPIGL